MRVYGVQLNIAWEDKDANFTRAEELVIAARPKPGSLIVLPEMFATGFSMNVDGIAEKADALADQTALADIAAFVDANPGLKQKELIKRLNETPYNPAPPTWAFLTYLSKFTGCYVMAGLVVRAEDGRGANMSICIGPDGTEVMRYQKLHPFSFAGEDEHYAPGVHTVVDYTGTSPDNVGIPTAPLICYDLRFPEAFRQATRQGAELIVVIACWPAPRREHWMSLLKARAIENQAFVVGVNRCGEDPKLPYAGDSRVISPQGEILAEAGSDECVISAEIDRNVLKEYRAAFPALNDIHPDLLGPAARIKLPCARFDFVRRFPHDRCSRTHPDGPRPPVIFPRAYSKPCRAPPLGTSIRCSSASWTRSASACKKSFRLQTK